MGVMKPLLKVGITDDHILVRTLHDTGPHNGGFAVSAGQLPIRDAGRVRASV